jgi:ATP-independent RNA helicase DbpA
MSGVTPFDSLPLKPALLGNLKELGYHQMTLVQGQSLPVVLAGRDALVRAKTGSGKTAAFGLGLLNRLEPTSFRVQSLVLCPTRELADQVAKELRRLARTVQNTKVLSLCGGVPFGPQVGSLQHGAHIIVGTPGRILKHLRKRTLRLEDVSAVVLDEADRMLDMGFAEDIETILSHVPSDRQTLLFSATYPKGIKEMSARVQRDPVTIDVTEDEAPAKIRQSWCSVTRGDRYHALSRALFQWGGRLNIVFCNTKNDCAQVAQSLQQDSVAAIAMHGDLEQPERVRALVRFANQSATVLVATDVAARGLDVHDVDAVFNYELSDQPEVYVHRIGRTGRAGKEGIAVSLVSAREEGRLRAIQEMLPDGEIVKVDAPTQSASQSALMPSMTTIELSGGRKSRLRPGDLLGAITANGDIPGKAVGKIDVLDSHSFIAVQNAYARASVDLLNRDPIKGKTFRARTLGSPQNHPLEGGEPDPDDPDPGRSRPREV